MADLQLLSQNLRDVFYSDRTSPLPWRLQQIRSVIHLLDQHRDDISHALYLDLGKSPFAAHFQETLLVKNACKLAIKNLNKWAARVKVHTPLGPLFPSSASILPEPYGVVLVISTWNFPLLLSLEPVVGAIAAGNAVALKTSEIAPATSSLLAKLVPTYLDNNAVKVVEGGVHETTVLLEQKWDKIFFTGSPQIGRIIMSAAAKHLTPVTLELGGKNPVLIDSTVDLKVAARRIVMGKWGYNNGQICIAADYILADESIASNLVSELRKTIELFYTDTPSVSPDLSRVVNQRHFSRLVKLLDDPLVTEKIVHGGQRDEENLYIEPTILLDPPVESDVMTEEIFGPVLPIITVKSMDQAIEFVKKHNKPLCIYVFTKNKAVKDKALKLSAGSVVINDIILQFAHEGLPFGGIGESGMGAYHGKFSFDTFSHQKAVLERGLWPDIMMRYPPFTPVKQGFLKKFLESGLPAALLSLCKM